MRRTFVSVVAAVAAMLLLASSALAMDCMNASKPNQAAGAQVVIRADTGEIEWASAGVLKRIQQGLIDPVTGAGYHGILGFDFEGDGVVDVSTWFGVGPDGEEIPQSAQFNGPACRGATSIQRYFTECLGA